MVEEMGLGIHAKQVATKSFIVVLATRPDTLLGDQIGDIVFPCQFEGSARLSRLNRLSVFQDFCQLGKTSNSVSSTCNRWCSNGLVNDEPQRIISWLRKLS